jgi:dihydrofolate reductase
MRKIGVFNHVSVDGFFAGANGEIDWFKNVSKDDDFDTFFGEQSKSGDTLIFGHTTYEMMKSYWPTPDAIKSDPNMAETMNKVQKIVFSKTLKSVEEETNWKNVTLFHEIKREEIVKLKEQNGRSIVILGSGTIVQQFAKLDLIDEYDLLVNPVILGVGKSMFKDVKMNLELIDSRRFRNGLVLLRYQPVK